MQRLVGGCPTFKTHLVPHWRESRCKLGGGGNQTAILTEDVVLLERWIYTALNWGARYVLINYHHKTICITTNQIFSDEERQLMQERRVWWSLQILHLNPNGGKRLWNVVIELWLSFWNWIKDPIFVTWTRVEVNVLSHVCWSPTCHHPGRHSRRLQVQHQPIFEECRILSDDLR